MNLRRWSPVVLTALACATVGHAQTTSGGARGVVLARGGKPLASASVVIRNLESGLTRTLATNAQGEYSFVLLPVGPYEMTVSSPGMKTAKDSRIHVSLGQNTIANFTMDTAEAAATVEVTAVGAALDTKEVNAMTSVNDTLVQSVPLQGRDFTYLVALTPMAAPDFDNGRISVGGARGIQNNLQIDGASYQSNFFGEQRGSTRIPFTFGADTIRELQIITNGYDAQYGNAAGAIINAVTKSGTNEFAGSALAQLRPSSMVAKIRPVPYDRLGTINTEKARTRNFTQNQFNINVGGPIIKDRLHYFVGVETYHYTEDMTPSFAVSASGGNDITNFNSWLAIFGKIVTTPSGGTLASESGSTYTSDRKNTVVFGRLDWTINENHRATLRVNSQDLKWQNGTTSLSSSFAATTGASSQGLEKDSGLSWVAELNSVFGMNTVNEFRLQRAIERRPRFSNSATPEIQISSGWSAGQTNFLPNGLDEYTWQVIDNLTHTSGDWTFKAGVDAQFFDFMNTFYRYQNGSYQFSNYATAVAWATGTLTNSSSNRLQYVGAYSQFNGIIKYKSSLLSGYLQGQYSGLLNRRLNVNLGVRYTRENQPTNPRPNPYLGGMDNAFSSSAVDPRIAFSFDINGDQKTVLKGGYGWFSSPTASLTVSNTMNSNGIGTSTYFMSSSGASSSVLAFFNSGPLSYAQRTSGGGTILTALPQDILRDATSYGFSASTLTGQVWDPDNKMARAKRLSIGLDHQYDNGLRLGLMGVYTKFENFQYFVNINMWQRNADGTYNPNGYYNDGYSSTVNLFTTTGASSAGYPSARPGFAIVNGRRLDFASGGFGNVALSKSDGQGTYQALVLTASKFSDKGYGFQSSLTYAQGRDNQSNERDTFGTTSSIANPAEPMGQGNWGYSDYDRRVRFTLAGYFPIYWGIKGSGSYSYTTGRPRNPTYSSDINGDTFTNDVVVQFGRNSFRQPGVKTLDLRLSRDFRFTKRFALEVFVDVFNVFNWANFRTTQNNYASSTTGTPFADFGWLNVADRNTREVQFGARFTF